MDQHNQGVDQHDLEVNKTIKVFGFLCAGLFALFLTGSLLVVFSSGKVSVKSSGKSSSFGTVEASILKPEISKAEFTETLSKAIALAKNDSLKKTPSLASKTPTKSHKEAKKEVNSNKDSLVVVVVLPPTKKGRKLDRNTELEVLTAIEAGIKRYTYADEKYGELMEKHCLPKSIDPDFGMSILLVESQAYPKVVSRVGASGLMQLMPQTGYSLAKSRGIKGSWSKIVDTLLFDPEISIMLGTDHIKRSFDFYGNYVHTANAYEAGDVGAFYQYQRAGQSAVDVAYYRKVYGIYQYIKAVKGLPFDPTMKAARLPSGLDSSLVMVTN